MLLQFFSEILLLLIAFRRTLTYLEHFNTITVFEYF